MGILCYAPDRHINPMPVELKPPTIVAKPADLHQLIPILEVEPLIAVDTESNSLYAYREQVCLIQISTRRQDFVIDPLAIKDLSALGNVLANPKIEKVFHAAEYDVMCLKRDYQFTFANIFDTMISARILGRKQIGLGNLLEEFFGVQVDKRYQRADWSQRPIPADQLRYAQHDTHYLPALRDILLNEMATENRLEEAHEVFDGLCALQPASYTFDPDGFWRLNNARDLSLRQIAVLRELYLLRNEIAQKRNWPPFKVMSDESLVNIVKANPETAPDLYDVPGLSARIAERYSSSIFEALQRGLAARLPKRPDSTPRLDPQAAARYDILHKWRKSRAAERGVESDVIIPKESLYALAKAPARTLSDLERVPGLGPWKRNQYGEELIQLFAKPSIPSSGADH
jgi:ribonuclease D